MKKWLVILLTLFLVACSSPRTAEQALQEQDYLGAMEIITRYVEETGEKKLTNDDLERFRNIINQVMVHYEQQLLAADRTDYAERIKNYQALLKMKYRLSDRFYSQQVYFFNNKYDVIQLRKLLAEEFYLYGNSIIGDNSQSYYLKASLYKLGLENFNYKDIATLYQQSDTKYRQLAAKEFYEQGQQFAVNKQYQKASVAFFKAVEVYQPLGQYKDSQTLGNKYDKLYRTEAANDFYNSATAATNSARSFKDYRNIAQLYQNAVNIYAPYGQYKDAQALAIQYKNKGIVKVYIAPSNYSSDLESKIRQDYINFIGSEYLADVVIKVQITDRYSLPRPNTSIKAMSENVTITIPGTDNNPPTAVNKTYYFNQEATQSESLLELRTSILVTGAMNYQNSYSVVESSRLTQYRYYGDVPDKYKSYSSGELLSQHKLYNIANKEMLTKIKPDIDAIAAQIKNL